VLPVSVHAYISAPREEIYDFVGDLAAREAWTDHFIEELRLLHPRTRGKGAAARFRMGRRWAETEIVEDDRPRRIVEEGRAGRLGRTPTHSVWEFIPEGSGLTRVELTTWTEPPSLAERLREGPLPRRRMRRNWKTTLHRLRVIFEERPDEPLARATVAGFEPEKAARFGF
jgi:hypothetical protein